MRAENIVNRKRPLMNRRQFIGTVAGGTLTLAATIHGENQELAPVKPETTTPGEKIAILYDKRLYEDIAPYTGAGVGVAGASMGNTLATPLRTQEYTEDDLQRHTLEELERKEPLKKIRRGLKRLAFLAALVDVVRGNMGSIREIRSLDGLADDLRSKGYQVVHTGDLERVMQELQNAGKNRPADAKTILAINAHGYPEQSEGGVDTFIQGERAGGILLSEIAEKIREIPGHTFVASKACHLTPKPFERVKEPKGRVTLFTTNKANARTLSWVALPLFEAMRDALRKSGDFIQNTEKAHRRLLNSAMNRIINRYHGSGLAVVRVGGHAERFEA
ncbi:MAG: hypothetical protein Q8P02_02125 [Candidatus Micrarchaeota archaeon]|nr:hypothetical protein [Candidatus Micrarchaeota archaeon]